MRLLDRGVLFGTSWPHRDTPKAETTKQIANRSFGQLDPIALLDHVREVDPPPTDNAMLGQIRPVTNQLGHLPFLLGREPRLRSRRSSIPKTHKAFRIVAVHPVAQDLPVHAARYRSLAARLALQHQRQGQHSPCHVRIIRTLRLTSKLGRAVVQVRDRNRCRHSGLLLESRRPANHAADPTGIPYKSEFHHRWY